MIVRTTSEGGCLLFEFFYILSQKISCNFFSFMFQERSTFWFELRELLIWNRLNRVKNNIQHQGAKNSIEKSHIMDDLEIEDEAQASDLFEFIKGRLSKKLEKSR